MRKITADACDAFEDDRAFRGTNTEVAVEDGATVMHLHGNAIAKREHSRLYIRTAGWATVTTKERLNGLTGVQVYSVKRVLHLNGKPWENHEDWTAVCNPDAEQTAADEAELQLKQQPQVTLLD